MSSVTLHSSARGDSPVAAPRAGVARVLVVPARPRCSPRLGRAAAALAAACLALAATPRALALLRFNDGRDQIYVTAYVGAGWDSNIFSRSTGSNDDLLISSGVGMEYSRKAGLIGMNGSLGWDTGNFANFSSENFINPSASLEFSKGTGRTTGAIQLNGRRETRADPTVGLRTDSWNYGVNLNYRYPVIERYSIAGNIGYDTIDYTDETTFSDLKTYTIGTDLFYSWRSDRDLLAGYRVRFSESATTSANTDHSVYVGVSGRIVSKLSGSARVGVSSRNSSYPGSIPDSSNEGLYVSVSGTWPATRKATFTLSATQDFNTTSTNFQTESTSVDLSGQFSHTVKFSTNASLGGGRTDYLSGFSRGSVAPTPGFNGVDRTDYYVTAGLGASYTINAHFTASVSYNYYQSWSNLASYDFNRHSINATLSTRW